MMRRTSCCRIRSMGQSARRSGWRGRADLRLGNGVSRKSRSCRHSKIAMSMLDPDDPGSPGYAWKGPSTVYQAMHPHDAVLAYPPLPLFVSIPTSYESRKRRYGAPKVKVAAVATAFPSGMSTRKVKLEETRWAVDRRCG